MPILSFSLHGISEFSGLLPSLFESCIVTYFGVTSCFQTFAFKKKVHQDGIDSLSVAGKFGPLRFVFQFFCCQVSLAQGSFILCEGSVPHGTELPCIPRRILTRRLRKFTGALISWRPLHPMGFLIPVCMTVCVAAAKVTLANVKGRTCEPSRTIPATLSGLHRQGYALCCA